MVKIAFPTDDGKTISRHFGMAPLFVVATIESDKPVLFERREKGFHGHYPEHHDHDHKSGGHGHTGMLSPIADCQILIAGGMGQPAYDSAVASGLQVILTAETTIEAALIAYQSGNLVSDSRRVHKHS